MAAPILPRLSPHCIPDKMMPLQRYETYVDLRAPFWQLRQQGRGAPPPGTPVPMDRVFCWPRKEVPGVTEQELNPPRKKRSKKKKKGPKLAKKPAGVVEKTVTAKFPIRFDFKRVIKKVRDAAFTATRGVKGAVEAASADASDVVSKARASAAAGPTTTPAASPAILALYTMPGTFPDDGAAAAVDAQIEASPDEKDQHSLLIRLIAFAVDVEIARRGRKRAREADAADEARDAKRRRVESDAQAQSRAEARPVAGKPARTPTTGATAPPHHKFTATAAPRAVRKPRKVTLAMCPPPTGPATVAKIVRTPSATTQRVSADRPIAGRPSSKPRASTPVPTDYAPQANTAFVFGADSNASFAAPQPSTTPPSPSPTSSPASSRSSSPASSRSSSPASSRSSSSRRSRSPSPEPQRSRRSSRVAEERSVYDTDSDISDSDVSDSDDASDSDSDVDLSTAFEQFPGTANGLEGRELMLYPYSLAWSRPMSGRPFIRRLPSAASADGAAASTSAIPSTSMQASTSASASTSAPASTSASTSSTRGELYDGDETEVESENGDTDEEDLDAIEKAVGA
ncbi:hypothetical protein AURDEDRAFT_111760 [Auricularia subglabra TFB-10046 SS5]|nr:hypothetical protein AURDEDRAFT_111760 [Auricularia subglabra TFB-10046 SS5]